MFKNKNNAINPIWGNNNNFRKVWNEGRAVKWPIPIQKFYSEGFNCFESEAGAIGHSHIRIGVLVASASDNKSTPQWGLNSIKHLI